MNAAVTHHRSRCRKSGASAQHAGRPGIASLQLNLKDSSTVSITFIETPHYIYCNVTLFRQQECWWNVLVTEPQSPPLYNVAYKALQRCADPLFRSPSTEVRADRGRGRRRRVTKWRDGACLRGRTVRLRRRRSSPLLDAVQVEDVEAAVAAPHRGHEPDHVAAHHALVLLLRELLDQTPCGRPTHSFHLNPGTSKRLKISTSSSCQSNLSVSPCSLASCPSSSDQLCGFDGGVSSPLWPGLASVLLKPLQLYRGDPEAACCGWSDPRHLLLSLQMEVWLVWLVLVAASPPSVSSDDYHVESRALPCSSGSSLCFLKSGFLLWFPLTSDAPPKCPPPLSGFPSCFVLFFSAPD